MSAPRQENRRAGNVDAVVVRRMRWWDIAPVAKLERDLFPHDRWTVETFWSELAGVPATRCYLVAESLDREIVGYAGLFAARDQADIQTIAVRSDHQRTGLGRRLLKSLLDEARRRGSREVFLEVRAENTAAIRLYEQAGFEVTGRRRGYYGRGADAIVMRCWLSDGPDHAPPPNDEDVAGRP
jgi:[ribosomal protein S18]-alanine N-acetyltransferase